MNPRLIFSSRLAGVALLLCLTQLHAQDDVTLNTAVTAAQTTTARMTVHLEPGFSVAGANGAFHAQIDYNQNGISDYNESLTAKTPTYWTGFEASDGFALGNINGQNGWYGGPDAPQVINGDSFEGARSVTFPARNPVNSLKRYFNPVPGSNIVFLDFAARPSASTTPDFSTTFDTGATYVSFVNSSGSGQVKVWNGDGSGGGSWVSVGSPVALTSSQSTNWIRFTLRIDYTAKKWDFFMNGQLVAYDLGFTSNGYTSLPSLTIWGSTSGATTFDFPFLSAINPLFVDNDQDGMDDNWETAHGANPTNPNDRNTVSGVQTYIAAFLAAGVGASGTGHDLSLEVFTPLP